MTRWQKMETKTLGDNTGQSESEGYVERADRHASSD